MTPGEASRLGQYHIGHEPRRTKVDVRHFASSTGVVQTINHIGCKSYKAVGRNLDPSQTTGNWGYPPPTLPSLEAHLLALVLCRPVHQLILDDPLLRGQQPRELDPGVRLSFGLEVCRLCRHCNIHPGQGQLHDISQGPVRGAKLSLAWPASPVTMYLWRMTPLPSPSSKLHSLRQQEGLRPSLLSAVHPARAPTYLPAVS